MDRKLKQSLLENALDFLKQGLSHYESALKGTNLSYKHAVLNFSIYIELSLKYFISTIHPVLIYKGVFSSKNLDNTLSTQESINFLKHLNQFEHTKEKEIKEFESRLDWLRQACNDIKHHEINMSTEKFKRHIGHILDALDWLYDQREVSVSDKLQNSSTGNFCNLYEEIIDSHQHEILISEKEAEVLSKSFEQTRKHDAPFMSLDEGLLGCPSCTHDTFVFRIKEDKYICTHCHHQDDAVICASCDETFPRSETTEEFDEFSWCSEQCLKHSKKMKGCD